MMPAIFLVLGFIMGNVTGLNVATYRMKSHVKEISLYSEEYKSICCLAWAEYKNECTAGICPCTTPSMNSTEK